MKFKMYACYCCLSDVKSGDVETNISLIHESSNALSCPSCDTGFIDSDYVGETDVEIAQDIKNKANLV